LPVKLEVSHEVAMTSHNYVHCLIGSLFFHIIVLLLVARMQTHAPVSFHAVEAFTVEPSAFQQGSPKHSIRNNTSTVMDGNAGKADKLQPEQHSSSSTASINNQNIQVKVPSANDASEIVSPQHVQAAAPAHAVLPGEAPGAALPDRSQGEKSGGTLSSHSPQHSGTEQVMVLGNAGSPAFIHRESPVYPYIARKLGKEGKVVLKLVLDAQGQVQGINIVEASGYGFGEAASAAIRKSTFAPAIRSGRPVSSQVLVPVRFVLREG
jgi:protein TonB